MTPKRRPPKAASASTSKNERKPTRTTVSAVGRLETGVWSTDHKRLDRRRLPDPAYRHQLANTLGRSLVARNNTAWVDLNKYSTVEKTAPVRRPPQSFVRMWTGDHAPWGSAMIADPMRQGTPMTKKALKAATDAMEYFSVSPPRLTEDTVFWRGVKGPDWRNPGPDFTNGYQDASFIAVSRSPAVAAMYQGNSNLYDRKQTVFKILVPKGTPIMPVTGPDVPNPRGVANNEVILLPGSLTRQGPDHFVTTFEKNQGVVNIKDFTSARVVHNNNSRKFHASGPEPEVRGVSPLSYSVSKVTPVLYTPASAVSVRLQETPQ